MRPRPDPDALQGPPPIDAFGEGGFRIAGVRHEGGVWILPGAVKPWGASDPAQLTPEDFAPVFESAERPDILVLGVGERLKHPPAGVRRAFREAGVGLETMDTPAACRAYNLLVGEARRIFAALMPV